MTNKQLKRIRELYGFSVLQLSKTSGLSNTYLHMIESGEKPLSEENAEKYLNGLYKLDAENAQKRMKSEYNRRAHEKAKERGKHNDEQTETDS